MPIDDDWKRSMYKEVWHPFTFLCSGTLRSLTVVISCLDLLFGYTLLYLGPCLDLIATVLSELVLSCLFAFASSMLLRGFLSDLLFHMPHACTSFLLACALHLPCLPLYLPLPLLPVGLVVFPFSLAGRV